MNVLVPAVGLAILLAVLVETMLEYLNIDPQWRPIILIIGGLIGISLTILGLVRVSRKKPCEESIGVILPEGYKSLEPRILRRILRWLKEN